MHYPKARGVAIVIGVCLLGSLQASADIGYTREGRLASKGGTWTGGAHTGIVFDAPDGAAPQLTGNVERFLTDEVSVGPLVQGAFAGDLSQFGLSGQVKYWMDIADAVKNSALVF